MVYRKLAGIILCLISLGLGLVTIFWPQSVSQSIKVTIANGLPGTINVTFPQRGWRGDWVTLMVELATPEMSGYDSPIIIRAELEMLGATEMQPQGSVSKVLTLGDSALFTWRLRSSESNEVNGTLWVFVGEKGGEELLLFGRGFSFDSMNYGFIHPSLARTLAVLCFVTGVFLFLWREKANG